MKKLILSLALVLGVLGVSHAANPIFGTVQISTNPVTVKPNFQRGAIDISSATIQDLRVKFGVKASTFTGDGSGLTNISASSISPGSTNYINVTSTLQNGATFYVSSGTVNSQLNMNGTIGLGGTSGTAGQSIQSNGASAPSWVNVPSAVLNTTSTWTANQTFSTVAVTSNLTVGSTLSVSSNTILPGATFYAGGVSTAISTPTIRGPLNMSSSKILNLANGVSSTDGANYGQIKFIQYVSSASVGPTNTASTSFVNTTLSVTITPTSSSSKILLLAAGELGTSNGSREAYATIGRGGTNLVGTRGMTGITGTITYAGASIVYIDSPASTSALTYTVMIRITNADSTAQWGQNDGTNMQTTSLVAVELGI